MSTNRKPIWGIRWADRFPANAKGVAAEAAAMIEILPEELFQKMLSLERKRADRSHGRFVLMLLKSGKPRGASGVEENLCKVLRTLGEATRETDITGWYEAGSSIGVIFTELGSAPNDQVANALLGKLATSLCSALTIEEINHIRVSLHLYPENSDSEGSFAPADEILYPDLWRLANRNRISLGIKRSLDVLGALGIITALSPVLLVIAAAIKLTSKGPILFRQQRVGQFGNRFTFLKFRSMYFANDPGIHKEYVRRFISGEAEAGSRENGQNAVYKIKADPRITPIGRFLRRTSLDEAPQFLNVLMGQMSLVGPRPPVPYEVEAYDLWHKRRLLAVKPGITGLWQVEGRSRVRFDDMVRLDLKYARCWSIWLDIKILLKTPKAVVMGEGAY